MSAWKRPRTGRFNGVTALPSSAAVCAFPTAFEEATWRWKIWGTSSVEVCLPLQVLPLTCRDAVLQPPSRQQTLLTTLLNT